MDSIFNRKLNSKDFLSERSAYQKSQIISQLTLCSKEINYNFSEHNENKLNITETTLTLCSIIESIFLHGLKDSIFRKTMNVFTGDDDSRRPDVNFWPPLMVISHKHIIEKVQSLKQISTDIGYCRAWIRLSFNDSLLSSYLKTIRKSPSSINNYYYQWAFLRDSESLEYTEKLIEGIETIIVFDLPANSSLLNQWNDWTLELAGVWYAPLKNHPITSGFDVASSLTEYTSPIREDTDENEVEIAAEEIVNENLYTKFYNTENRNPDQLDPVEKIIQELNENLLDDDEDKSTVVESAESPKTEVNDVDNNILPKTSQSMGNSLNSKMGWSSHDIAQPNAGGADEDNKSLYSNPKDPPSRSNSMNTSINSPIDRHSFHSLLEKHETKNTYNKNKSLTAFNELWERFESTLQTDYENSIFTKSANDSGTMENSIATEILTEFNDKYTVEELQELVEQTCKLGREPGLDAQGYICKSCANPLGIGFAKAIQVCAFSGYYFCDSCMSPELFIIPAKVIYNWDFRKYPVSLHSASFLTDFQYKPFIDLKLVNPEIHNYVTEMAELQTLRIQLNFIRAYLFTCCEKIIKQLQEIINKKEYYHEHIYRYSINDLNMIQKGRLHQTLEKTVNFGRDHILDCPLCSQKGFICEICNSPKVLYPFDVASTYRCGSCGTIFHSKCFDDMKPCPKCDRKKRRQDLPLLEVGNENEM